MMGNITLLYIYYVLPLCLSLHIMVLGNNMLYNKANRILCYSLSTYYMGEQHVLSNEVKASL
jgi:hypothetical protein